MDRFGCILHTTCFFSPPHCGFPDFQISFLRRMSRKKSCLSDLFIRIIYSTHVFFIRLSYRQSILQHTIIHGVFSCHVLTLPCLDQFSSNFTRNGGLRISIQVHCILFDNFQFCLSIVTGLYQ